jgi:hypothetical protein
VGGVWHTTRHQPIDLSRVVDVAVAPLKQITQLYQRLIAGGTILIAVARQLQRCRSVKLAHRAQLWHFTPIFNRLSRPQLRFTMTKPPPPDPHKTEPEREQPSVPDGAQLPPFGPISSQAVAERLRVLECSQSIKSYVDFCRAAQVKFPGVRSDKGFERRLSRWINNAAEGSSLLGEGNYILLATHMMKKCPEWKTHIGVPIFSMLQAPLYHAIAPFLNCQKRTEGRDLIINHMVGEYETYKASARYPGYGYVGLMEIKYVKTTDAILTRERYCKSETETWDVPGTIYPITDDVFIILAIDVADTGIKVTFVNERGGLINNKVPSFTGWIADTDRRKYFTTVFCAKRLNPGHGIKLEFMRLDKFPKDITFLMSRELNDDNYIFTPA